MNIIYWGQTEWDDDSREEETSMPTEEQLAFDPDLQIQQYHEQPTAEDERFVRQFMADRLCSGL